MKFSLQQVRDVAALAVQERGHTYIDHEPYWYFDDERNPSCLVGWVLNYLGADTNLIWREYNEDGIAHLACGDDDEFEWDVSTERYLTVLQSSNDHGMPWGIALQAAEMMYQEEMDVTTREDHVHTGA